MRLALLLLSLLAVVAAAAGPSGPARAQGTVTIDVGDLWFCSQAFSSGVCETTVQVGDTVTWRWVGSQPHTTTECGGDLNLCPAPHLWDSPTQTVGTFPFTFDTVGTYAYRCQVHQFSMFGRIVVVQPTPTPTPAPTATPSPTSVPMAAPQAGSPTATPAVAAAPAAGGPPAGVGTGRGPWWLMGAGAALLAAATVTAVLRQRRL